MTATIRAVVLGVDRAAEAEAFYAALELSDRVQVGADDTPSSGFRGYTLSLVVSQPATADAYVRTALHEGAELVKEPSKSLWGYGGAFRAPDGTIWTVASSSKRDAAPASLAYLDLVLLLGAEDVKASKRFYVEHGLQVGKAFGSKYAELRTEGIQLALQPRRAVAKNAGVDPEGTGSHRITVLGGAGSFTDPDGFVWDGRGAAAAG